MAPIIFNKTPLENVIPSKAPGKKTQPGRMSQRSCVFFGARYVLGPVKEAVHIVHGGAGCGYYGKMVRGVPHSLYSTDMQQNDVIFGGADKLKTALFEALSMNPEAKGAFIYITCLSAIIGEDAEGVAREVSQETGRDVKVVSCPGFCAPSQSGGHGLGFRMILDMVKPAAKPYQQPVVNLVGEFNVGGESVVIKSLLKELGIHVHTALTGATSWTEIEEMANAQLNLLFCGSTAEEFCREAKTRFGQPYMKVSFYGLKAVKKSLYKIGTYFDIPEERIQKVIAKGQALVSREAGSMIDSFKGKRAVIVLGAGRIGALSRMLTEMGFQVEMAASIFGKKVDHDEARPFARYITDDPGDYELEASLKVLQPDIVLTNAREQWRIVKSGFPVVSFPQQKDRGPYAGFTGVINFSRDLYHAMNAPVWSLMNSFG